MTGNYITYLKNANMAELFQLTTLVSLRHNLERNLTASLLDEVCHDVCVERQLLQLTGENLNEKMAIRSDEV